MAHYGAKVVVPIDLKKKPWEQKHPLHNRWHPDIPVVAEVKDGEVFRVEMVDFSGGGITSDYSAEDVKHADQSIVSFYLHLLPPHFPFFQLLLQHKAVPIIFLNHFSSKQ